ncbi:MAG: hypothetical protein M3Z92_02780 [Bacteroidota bacterium]|nr:hypothetical protein [Bacteroidota bacterium]
MKPYSILLFLLIAFSFSNCCYSQKVIVNAVMENKKASPESDTIYYDFNRPLTWNDFKGKPDDSHNGGAVTASGFAFDSQMKSDGTNIYINIGVYTFFTKNDSWKKPNINSEYHLLHEQHHFDITRLSAEKLAAELRKAHVTKNNYRTLLTSIFDAAYKENSDIQNRYDKETNHSIDVAKQREWNSTIDLAIKKLKDSALVKK